MGDGTGRRAQAHAAAQALDLTLHLIQRLLGIGQQPARAFKQGLANGRRMDLPALARQQRRTDACFEVGNVQADGGRRQVENASGLGKGTEVGNHHQGAQAVEADFTHGL
ncbi:hypothetical protein D9M73_258550 [compost metagenome]